MVLSLKTCFSVNKYNVKLWRSGNKIRTNATKKRRFSRQSAAVAALPQPRYTLCGFIINSSPSLPLACLHDISPFFYKRSPNLFLGGTCFLEIFSPGHVCGRRASFHMELVHQSRHDISIKHQPPAKLRGNKSSLRPESM